MTHDGPGIRTVVFLKGCPLRCFWCSSPQTWHPYREVIFFGGRCIRCNKCKEVCPEGAISSSEEGKKINRKRCTRCGKCVSICPTGALEFVGHNMSVEDVINEVRKCETFWFYSNSGVTISGGEPLMQIDFVVSILKKLKSLGHHTAVETAGHVKWENLKRALEYTDLLLHDLKHMDPEKHKEITTHSNELILENLRKVAKRNDVRTVITFPVILGVNDSEKNIGDMINFMKENKLNEVDIFPFHNLGQHEYDELEMEYPAKDLPLPSEEKINEVTKIFTQNGIDSVDW